MVDPRTPVLVGVGQLSQRVDRGAPALEPVDLLVEAARLAGADAGVDVLGAVDTIRVVGLISWRYQDPGRLVGRALGLGDEPRTGITSMGGNSPQLLVNRTAADIVAGTVDCALLGGAEAWRTRQDHRRRGDKPPWSELDESIPPAPMLSEWKAMTHPDEPFDAFQSPIEFYPLMENGRRHRLGRPLAEHLPIVGDLWSRFSAVAADNPVAWRQEALTPEAIITPTPDNRYVGFPYTKVMNSYENVDQGAAMLLCSAEKANELGVPRDRWIFVHGGTDAGEHQFVSHRADLSTSPAIGMAGRALFDALGTGPDTIDHVDLYSCFPVAVQLGAEELGFDLDRQLTQTGGLAFMGGPWNNYASHGIGALAQRLRADGGTGFTWANGGLFSKHAMGVYGTEPGRAPFVSVDVQADIDATPTVELDAGHVGPVTIESWVVMHDGDNRPTKVIAGARTPIGARTWATSTDATTCARMADGSDYIDTPAERAEDGTLAI